MNRQLRERLELDTDTGNGEGRPSRRCTRAVALSEAERREKQAQYNRDYRVRLRDNKRPTREDVAEAWLRMCVGIMIRAGSCDVPETVLRELTAMGFDKDQSVEVIEELAERESLRIS